MNLIIEVIKNSGLEQEKIQDVLSKIKYKGVTGTIQFDKYGKRLGAPMLVHLKNGIQVPYEN
jgi:ABC-type branched-subunit amino acid transport system substrate-binding protein